MRTMYCCTLVVALFAGGCAASKGESVMRADYDPIRVEKVAIVEVTGRVSGETVKNQISDFFVMELLKKGYTPVERRRVQALLKEQEFQASDVTSDEGAARAGRILNVPAVLVINIPTYKESMNMTAKMIDVEDGSILWIGTGSGTTGKTAATILGAAAGAAAGVLVAGDETDDKVIGGVIGGVLGGVAGHALSPQQAEQVKKVIKKVCKDLPYRVPVAKK
ncbi:MAG: CsgG/HfaB family protein [Planctomycetota bacterium]